MAEAGPGKAGGYVAFISYSHKDAAVGRWLHRKLEGYRLPRRLAGTKGEDGEVPARLTPIFRDRDELPAAGDLSERVRAALAVSRNLIVVCSPNSAASPWVAKEIATFRELHPDRPVFTAIVEGEPDQCFPPVLREGGIEPLAADLRKAGDGKRLGILKLVAGLSGVGLDALVQRDASRRIRRVTYVTATAVMAMLAMALLTAFALNARAEAESQRTAAEGLVEFMLTDLRDKLRGVGRLDVLTTVNERALAYYSVRDGLERLSNESLARRARIFQAMGDDNLERHNTAAGLSAFEEARRTTEELVSRTPHDRQRLYEHAKSIGGIGRTYELDEKWPAAEHHFMSFGSIMDRLLASAPRDADYLMRAATAAIDVGSIQLRGTKDFPAAQKSYERALFLLRRAEGIRPSDPHILLSQANASAWLADSFYYRERWSESLSARLIQHRIVSKLHEADRLNADISFRLAAAERGLAYSLLRTGKPREAHSLLLKALGRVNDLVARDRENADWRGLQSRLNQDLLEIRPAPRPARARQSLHPGGGGHDTGVRS